MELKEYEKKRSLAESSEPGPAQGKKNKGQYLVFVVHKHAARRLHYDLRLEMGGVLRSFAVPKGPSLDPSVKRLAVLVEDHPFAYKDFEGVIPKGNYGAGAAVLWDRGLYGPPFSVDRKRGEELLLEGLKKGNMKFVLAGTKLRGEFALVKTGWDEKSWLLLKHRDQYASTADVLADGRSVLSGATVEELSSAGPPPPAPRPAPPAARGAMPHNIKPMLAMAVKKPFNHADWLFEIKWDGYRAIAELDRENVSLYSRNHVPLAKKFPPVMQALRELGLWAVLDGEIVVAGDTGVADFQKLQDFPKSRGGHLAYYVFDVLFLDGRDLTGLPLIQRKELLKSVLRQGRYIKYSDHVKKDGVSFFEAAEEKGVEGIVAKHSQSAYRQGARSGQWLKIKRRVTQDCVIAGFTRPRGSRDYLGSLVLGAYDKGDLVYIGHSGGAFGSEDIKAVFERLRPLARKTCPFPRAPKESGRPRTTWVRPVLVCEVAFTGWTKEKVMRQPVFLRFRDDKGPRDAEAPDKGKKEEGP